jgi:hypothetical protein
MENLNELFKAVVSIQNKAYDRAHQLLMAQGCKYNVFGNGYAFDDDKITVKFEEDTHYDFPGYISIELTIDQLTMNDSDWNNFIEKVKLETELEEQKKIERNRKIELEINMRQYNELKKKLDL